VLENASFSLIKTPKSRCFLLRTLRETTSPQRPLMRRALYFLKCLGALRVVVALKVLF